MVIINIPASKSVTVSNKNSRGIADERIIVGNKGKCMYHSYLFFDTSTIPNCISLVFATLLLFKIADFFNCSIGKFSVYPLLTQFSSFTTYESDCSINIDPTLKRDFSPFTCEVAIEVDITAIVDKWISNALVNRGIVIKGNNTIPYLSHYTSFGSAYSKDNTLIPCIRVALKQGPSMCLLPSSDICYTAKVFPSLRR